METQPAFVFCEHGVTCRSFLSSPIAVLTQCTSTYPYWWMMGYSLQWSSAAKTGTSWLPLSSASCTRTSVGLGPTRTAPHWLVFVDGRLAVGGFSGIVMLFPAGGSETFQDKVNFFQRELRHIHSKKPRTKTCLKITRHSILDSVSTASLHRTVELY